MNFKLAVSVTILKKKIIFYVTDNQNWFFYAEKAFQKNIYIDGSCAVDCVNVSLVIPQ